MPPFVQPSARHQFLAGAVSPMEFVPQVRAPPDVPYMDRSATTGALLIILVETFHEFGTLSDAASDLRV